MRQQYPLPLVLGAMLGCPPPAGAGAGGSAIASASALSSGGGLEQWLRAKGLGAAAGWAQPNQTSATKWDACGQLQVDCGPHGTCGEAGVCRCDPDFGGPDCSDYNECAKAPCLNGGSCFESSSAVGAALKEAWFGMFACGCLAGFEGLRCQCRSCGEHGACTAAGACQCSDGWQGPQCTRKPDPCRFPTPFDCNGRHGSCVPPPLGADGSYPDGAEPTCRCLGGFSGARCLTAPDPCLYPSKIDCGSHGHCDGGACICSDGFRGPRCRVAPPPKPLPSENASSAARSGKAAAAAAVEGLPAADLEAKAAGLSAEATATAAATKARLEAAAAAAARAQKTKLPQSALTNPIRPSLRSEGVPMESYPGWERFSSPSGGLASKKRRKGIGGPGPAGAKDGLAGGAGAGAAQLKEQPRHRCADTGTCARAPTAFDKVRSAIGDIFTRSKAERDNAARQRQLHMSLQEIKSKHRTAGRPPPPPAAAAKAAGNGAPSSGGGGGKPRRASSWGKQDL
eukprot:SAG22_NODE_417_length_10770_cov_21.649049_6_plen_511_part_00